MSNTELMVERVAKAMAAELRRQVADNMDCAATDSPNETYLDGTFDLGAVAKAAVEAMREPNKKMIGAAFVATRGRLHPSHPKMIFGAMIDAALRENQL